MGLIFLSILSVWEVCRSRARPALARYAGVKAAGQPGKSGDRLPALCIWERISLTAALSAAGGVATGVPTGDADDDAGDDHCLLPPSVCELIL